MFTRWYKILQTCPFKTPFQVELLWEWHPRNCRWGRQLRIQVNELTEAPLNQPFLVIFSHPDGIPRGTIKVWTMEHLNLDAHGDNFSVVPFETLYYCCGHMWLFQNLAKCLLGTFGSVCICSTHTVYYKCTSKLFWSILGKTNIWIFGWIAPKFHWLRLWIHDAFPRTFTGALSKWSVKLNTERHCEGIWSSDRPPEQNT